MYEKHFDLRQRPFRSAPDASRYYPATGHEQALSQLLHALTDNESIALLTGEPGAGKTLLCHCLLSRCGEVRTAFLTNSHFSDRTSLLQAILYDLSLPYEGRSEQELRLALTDDLLRHAAENGPTLLLVDEAHHLSIDLLEELRLLSNLEGGNGRALQVVLVAQPGLMEALSHPRLSALRQRLAVRAEVGPLSEPEAADYLLHHLRVVCDHPERVMTEETLEVLARATGGVPRLLNQAAHRALTLAHGAGADGVDVEAALEALAILGLDEDEDAESADGPVCVSLVTRETEEGKAVVAEAAAPAGVSRVYAAARSGVREAGAA